MTESESNSDSEVVAVTKHGQATIPKRFREKLGISAPGTVSFRETEDGAVVVERVASPAEMRGFAARRGSATTEEAASTLLREQRLRDREARP